jgi:peptidoglycan/LPS O-acetylase OafA/YrhL
MRNWTGSVGNSRGNEKGSKNLLFFEKKRSKKNFVPAGRHPMNKLRCLELARFIAALWIMLSHVLNYIRIDKTLRAPDFLLPLQLPQPPAVVFFFVLSGFVMMLSHGHQFGQKGAAPKFFWRRACRIYPAYWLAMILPLWLFTAPWPFWLQLMSLAPIQTNDYDGVAWTLRYEMAFYLIFGLGLLPVIGRYILAAWIAVVLLFWLPQGLGLATPHALAMAVLHAAQGSVTKMFLYALDELFLAGMAAALLYRYLLVNPHWCWPAIRVGMVCLAFDVYVGGFGFSYGAPCAFVLGGAGFGLLIAGLAGLEAQNRLRLGSWAQELGKISYPLYVIHESVILLLVRLMANTPLTSGRWAAALAALLMLSLSLAASGALTYLFDQPLQKRLRTLFRKDVTAASH